MSTFGKNFEKLENKILNIPTDIVDSMRKNNLVTSVVLLFILYFVLAAPKMSPSVTKIFNNNMFKLVYIFLVVCLVSKNPALALIVSLVLVVGLNKLIKSTTKQTVHRDTLEVPYEAPAFIPSANHDKKKLSKKVKKEKKEHFNNNNGANGANGANGSNGNDSDSESDVALKVGKEHFNGNDNDSDDDGNEMGLTARQQMKTQWDRLQDADPALLEGFATKGQNNKKCASTNVNAPCDVLGVNEYHSTSHARVAENDADCPEDGDIKGFYENIDKEYASITTIDKKPLSQ
jgi:hypothetical protein